MEFHTQRRKSNRVSLLVSLAAHALAAAVLSVIIVANREAILSGFTPAEMITIPETKPKIRMPPNRVLQPPSAPRVSIQAPPSTPPAALATAADIPTLSSDTFSIPSGYTKVPSVGSAAIRPVHVAPTVKPSINVVVPVVMPKFNVNLERMNFQNGNSPIADLRPAVPSALANFALDTRRDRRSDSLMEYEREIRERISRAQEYPRFARENGLEGTTQVLFTLRRDGSLVNVKVVASAGSKALDEAAVGAIRGAAPFPPFPDGQRTATLPFELSIVFNLRDRG